MDPLTQASLGAAAAAAFSGGRHVRLALLVGAVAGAAPDLDVLIQSDDDPMLGLEYHRHFTHALVFAPLIGLVVAGLFRLLLFRRRPDFFLLARFAVAAALTHGLLDTCTSYGTLLYWPFSSHRESWDIISIIDPLFTGPLVALLAFAALRRRPGYARLALCICVFYLGLGVVQRERAERFARELAESRGHEAAALTARPSLANLLLWRVVYREGSQYHVDAVWLGLPGSKRLYPGGGVAAFTPGDARAQLPEGSTQWEDVERFRFFSQGYLYLHPEQSDVIGDLRYAIFPDSLIPLWGIRVDAARPGSHVSMEYFRSVETSALDRLWRMVRGLESPFPPHSDSS
ncbi:MAG: metal-dependent hydrolase, partial [Opitutales bacterium]